jgi:hypothetical protein
VIIEAAKRWVEAADAPRFSPPLVKWLSAGGWNNDPPQKRTALPAKKRAASSAKRRGKADLATLSLMDGGYVEDEAGSLVWGAVQ